MATNNLLDVTERVSEMTGGETTDLNEAIDQWENERAALAEFQDENQALEISNRRLRLALELAEKAIDQIETEAGMFVTTKTRGTIEKFHEQVKKSGNAIIQSKLIIGKQ